MDVDSEPCWGATAILADVVSEADRVLAGAQERAVLLRLLGGVGIRLHSPSAASVPALTRSYADLDLCARAKDYGPLKALFTDLGYAPDARFNSLHGKQRMMFHDEENGRQADVFLDVFKMCHALDLRPRMPLGAKALPPSDLLLTKLQVVKINLKDFRDIITLLLDHPVASEEGDVLNAAYISDLCSQDWGLYRTCTGNLAKVQDAVNEIGLPGRKLEATVMERVDALVQAIESAPKGARWRLRAAVGDRVPWYELPDEVNRK